MTFGARAPSVEILRKYGHGTMRYIPVAHVLLSRIDTVIDLPHTLHNTFSKTSFENNGTFIVRFFKDCLFTMIRARASVARRVLASQSKNARTFHSSSLLGRDALDMVDTFARRHSKSIWTFFSCFLIAYVIMACQDFCDAKY